MGQQGKRQLKKRTVVLLRALGVLTALALLWAFAVEPLLLTVTEITVTDARLPAELNGLRVVFVSDIHVGPFYSERDVERATARIASLEPDVVLFGGDLLQQDANAAQVDGVRVAHAFAQLKPRLGKYAVFGNHDIRTERMRRIALSILERGGFTVLENAAAEASPGFFVAGTASWSDLGEHSEMNRADVSAVANTTENGNYSLLLSHEPAQARNNARYPFALQLSGHTHGGQVGLPLIGLLAEPNGAQGFTSGLYEISGLKLFVSRGVGTSVVRARLFVPPEIAVITLYRD